MALQSAGGSALHVSSSLSRTRIHGPRFYPLIAQLFLFLNSYRVGNRAAFSDSRSNFHTRVGYRTNVCRRRLASDLARASDVLRPKGLTRITMTGRPVPHPKRWKPNRLRSSSEFSSPDR